MNVCSERLKELFQQSRLSYSELEKLTGIPRASLQRYASGKTMKIPLDAIEIIASKLNADARYLVGWDISDDGSASFPLSEKEIIIVNTYRSADARGQMRIERVVDEVLEEIEKKNNPPMDSSEAI